MPDRLPQKLSEVLELFDSMTSPEERVPLLLDYAEQFREVPPSISTRPFPDDHLVKFCESEAYVWVIPHDGRLTLHFAIGNPSGVSAKALAAILEKTLSGATPEEIASIPDDIVSRVFRQNISMGKGMGLMSIVQTVKALASHYAKSPVSQVA